MIPGSAYDVVNQVPMTKFDGVGGSKLYFINTMAEWRAFYELLMARKLVACDTETSGFEYYNNDHIVGMSFGWNDTHFYIPVRHVDSELGGAQPPQLSMEDLKDDLVSFFSQKDVFTLWHNCKFDALFYRREGIEILTPCHDTMILWQLFDENAPAALKVIASGWRDELGVKHAGLVGPEANEKEAELSQWRFRESKARRDIFKKLVMDRADELQTSIEHQDKKRAELKRWIIENELYDHPYRNASKEDVHYGYVPADLMTEYAATDTFLTHKVYEHVMKNMAMDQKLQNVYINELKLTKALIEAEWQGAKVDRTYLYQLGQELDKELEDQERKIKEQLGDINLNSTMQLAQAFLDAGVKLTKKTPAGQYALDKKILEELSKEYDVAAQVLDLRKNSKIRGTYVTGILEKLTDDDILHCSFNQNVSTGRMSSRSPNLQNLPGKDDRIRKAFVCKGSDYVYILADYSQVEVRLTAHYSRDPLLLDAYKKGQDIHTRTMCEMFGFNYEEVNAVIKADDPSHPMFKEWKILRTAAKIVNFGIIYGVSAMSLSEQVPRPEQYKNLSHEDWILICDSFIDSYFQKYKGVKRFINQMGREIRKKGIVYNHFGRPRRLPHALLQDRTQFWRVRRAQRQGVNFLIQGTCADIFKIAVVRVHELLKGTKSYMVNFVHDEIQIYLHKDEFHLLNDIKKAMEDFNFAVPIVADVAWTTTNWADKRELG